MSISLWLVLLALDYSPRYLGHEIASGRSESNVWSVANTDLAEKLVIDAPRTDRPSFRLDARPIQLFSSGRQLMDFVHEPTKPVLVNIVRSKMNHNTTGVPSNPTGDVKETEP